MENPFPYLAGGTLAASGAKAALDYMGTSNMAGAGMLSKGLRTAGPMLGAQFAPGVASWLGATDKEAEVIGAGATGLAGGYYGWSGATGMMKDNLAGRLVNTTDMKALKARAKELGIAEVDGKDVSDKRTKISKEKLRAKIANKVQSQSYRASTSSLSKATRTSLPKTGSLKSFKLPKLGGGMNLAMAAFTIPQIINLAKELFGGGGTTTPTKDTTADIYAPSETRTREPIDWR